MTGVQYYRRALVTPCALFLVAAIPGVFALRGFVAVGFVMVALAAAFGGADQADEGAKAVLLPLLLLVWASPAFVAYLLVMPIALRRIWRSPEEAYRKVSARLPLGVFAATFLIIVALTTHHLGWKSVILGVFVAVPGAVVAYAYWGVAGLVLTMLRSTSVVGEATGGGTPSSRGVAVAAVLGLGCGVAMLAAAAVGMSHVSSDREIVADAERGAEVQDTPAPMPGAVSAQTGTPDPVASPGPDQTAETQMGTLVDVAGSILVVRSAEAGPPVGTTASLSKRVTLPIGDKSMWVEIARVRVAATDGDLVTLEVLEERSVLTVNDRKHDYFAPGSQVRLRW